MNPHFFTAPLFSWNDWNNLHPLSLVRWVSTFSRTEAACPISSAEVNSSGEWLMPFLLGTDSMAEGSSWPRIMASWPAQLGCI